MVACAPPVCVRENVGVGRWGGGRAKWGEMRIHNQKSNKIVEGTWNGYMMVEG